MWASETDYASLYTDEYFGKISGVASFDADIFPGHVARICREVGCRYVVDIGSGSGILGERLLAQGIEVVSCDYNPSHENAIHFDLSSTDPENVARTRVEIDRKVGSEPYLVTCFDVLEHIGSEDVAAALSNLRAISKLFALFSISTRPSSADNAYHATVVPLSTWKRMLSEVGFDVVEQDLFQDARRILPKNFDDPKLCLVEHWAKVDLFGDRRAGEPQYFLLRADRWARTDEASTRIDVLLDIAFRKRKREQFGSSNHPKVALNIHHVQDFLSLRPLYDVFQRHLIVALLRTGMLREDEISWMRGFHRRCGVPLIEYEAAAEIDWTGLGIQRLISASESTVATSHLLSRHLIETARMNDVPSLLLQHGIWIEPFYGTPISFGSDAILSWGHEHQSFFAVQDKVLGRQAFPRGQARGVFHVAGSAKYADMLTLPETGIIATRLGIDTSRFAKTVLVGTNLLWGRHGASVETVRGKIASIIAEHRDIFFLVKVHPSERATDYEILRAENCIIIDDILLGCMDIQVQRLINGADVVVSSLSTLLLDAAVAGKTCIQYDTKNSLGYEGCVPFSLDEISRNLALPNVMASTESSTLKAHYADGPHDLFFENLRAFIEGVTPSVSLRAAYDAYSLSNGAEAIWLAARRAAG